VAKTAGQVVVIDDDPSVREALESLLQSVGHRVNLYGSIPEFLAAPSIQAPTCLVLDVRLPGPGGLEFQRSLAAAGVHPPIIFITGHGDIPMSVQAMKGGAIEFMTKDEPRTKPQPSATSQCSTPTFTSAALAEDAAATAATTTAAAVAVSR
jgi:FixJ family two-component response regulator